MPNFLMKPGRGFLGRSGFLPRHPLLRPPVFVLSSLLPPTMSEFEEAKVVADPEVEVSPSVTCLHRENQKMRGTPLIMLARECWYRPAGQAARHAWPDDFSHRGQLAPTRFTPWRDSSL